MPTKRLPLDVDDLIRRYAAGESHNAIAETLGVSGETIRDRLTRAGVRMRSKSEAPRPERVAVDSVAIVSRYLAGESEKALAAAFGISRSAIRMRLRKAGVEPRGRSAAMYQRMANTSPEERRRIASASHDAARGSRRTEESLIERAASIEGRTTVNVSPAELALADDLRSRGLSVVHQKAIGKYNVDLATGTVAVEVLGGSWHRAKRHGERLRYILDAGWDVIYVWVDVRRWPLGPDAAQCVVEHCEFRDRNPSAGRCYRVIRGSGEFVAEGSADRDDIPDVLPINDRPDVAPAEIPFGECHCGCGRSTRIAPKTYPERGWVKGQPIRYISGHNAQKRWSIDAG